MEHRCGTRQKVGITVLVRRRGWAGSVVAELTDLSITGAFIAAPPEVFPVHSMLRIKATPPFLPGNTPLSCRAMVARLGTDGIGVVFDQTRPRGLAPLFDQASGDPASGSGRAGSLRRGRGGRDKRHGIQHPVA
ncbi:MAG: PilZ domain-containing protein [Gammaproteobacteria bacterium]